MKIKVIPKEDMYTHYHELLLKKGEEYELKEYQEHDTYWGKVKSYYVINEEGNIHLMGTFEGDDFWMDHANKKHNFEMIKDNHKFRKAFELIK